MKIIPSTLSELSELTALAKTTFLQSHGHCACASEVAAYVNENFTEENFRQELSDPHNLYFSAYHENILIGYSKIICDSPFKSVTDPHSCKMERLYVLDKMHGKGIGKELFDFNIALARKNKQSNVWLFVWVENKRAIRFYEKQDFVIVGEHDFRISDQHYNPNHQMRLEL